MAPSTLDQDQFQTRTSASRVVALTSDLPGVVGLTGPESQDTMSSAPPQTQQHLSSTDMTMLGRVLNDVCDQNTIAGGSADAQRIAALLITEFQRGVTKEADLAMAFIGEGSLRLYVPVGRLSRLMGNRLFGWEDDVGPGASGSLNKEHMA